MEDTDRIHQQLEEEFACGHEHAGPRRKVTRSGQTTVWRQCPLCGQQLERLPLRGFTRPALAALPLFDEGLRERRWRERAARRQELFDVLSSRQSAEWWAWYQSYLASPAWAAKREAVFQRECIAQNRADPRCQGCGRAAGTIAHHLTYAHVGAEFLFELALVCRGCHDQLHPERREQSA